MLKKQNKYKMVAFLAFALYFLTGAACIVVGKQFVSSGKDVWDCIR